jgi:hypothetical protein
MTTDAFHLMMLSEQWVLGLLVMVEQNLFPAHFVMTGFALGPKGTSVLVVLIMTVVA